LVKTKFAETKHADASIAAIAAGVFSVLDSASIVSGADALSTNGSNGGPGTSNWRKTARTEALQ
jgi:hypothetical protein